HADAAARSAQGAARRRRGRAAWQERCPVMSLVATAPALPLHKAGPYVAAAYIVFLVVILIYVGIMATRLRRTERELSELRAELQARERAARVERDLESVADGRLMRGPA